jgi:MFS family permease
MGATARLPGPFWWFATGRLLSDLGSAFTAVALPLLVLHLTGSALDLGASTALNYLPWALFGLIGGALVDRVDRKRTMIVVDSARGAVIALVPLLAALGELRLGWVYAVVFAQATLGVLYSGGSAIAVVALVEPDQLTTANARLTAGSSAATVAGSALAGLLFAVAPVTDGFWVDAFSFVLSAATLALIRRSFNDTPPPGLGALRVLVRSLLADTKEGLLFVWHQKAMLAVSSELVLVNLFGSAATAEIAYYATHRLGADDSRTGVFYAASGLGVILFSFVVGPLGRRVALRPMVLLALTLYSGSLIGMGLLSAYWPALIAYAVGGGATVFYNVTTTTARQRMVPAELRGRVWNIALVFAWSAIPVGSLAGGALVARGVGVGPLFAGVGVVILVVAVAFDRLALRRS